MCSDKNIQPSKCKFACLVRPVTKYNVLYYYAPLQSLAAYGALSVNIMNPSLVAKLVAQKDITNILLINTLVGSSLYFYGRPHLRNLPPKTRATYSVCGGVMFSFGSVLIWAVIRSFLRQDQNLFATLLGLGSGALVTKVGIDYVNHVDSLVPRPVKSDC